MRGRVVVGAVLALAALASLGLWRWAQAGAESDPVAENASIACSDGCATMRYALVTFDEDENAALYLSPTRISCADHWRPDEGASVALGAHVSDGAVTVDLGGHRGPCVNAPSQNITTPPPPTSFMHVDSQSVDVLRGTLTIDEEWWVPSRKGEYCDGSAFHSKGGGTFEARICRTRWQRLRAQVGH